MDSENTYIIDSQNEAELARLILQENLINKRMDLLPPSFVPKRETKVKMLDLACGPGQWAQTVAEKHAHANIVGIDIDPLMLAWARNQIRTTRVSFQIGNILKPLPFPDNTFDLVNARLLMGVMIATHWPLLIQECFRITKPGGILRMTEPHGASNATASSYRLDSLIHKAYWQAGKTFTPWDYGVVPQLGLFFKQVGYSVEDVRAYVLDQSFGADLHAPLVQGTTVFLQLVQPFLRKYLDENETQDLDNLCTTVAQEMLQPTYRSYWYLISVIGRKPDTKA